MLKRIVISLDLPIEKLSHVGPRHKAGLKRLGIITIGDLIRHFPARYEDFSNAISISDIGPAFAQGSGEAKEAVTVQGEVEKVETVRAWKRRLTITTAYVNDGTDSIRVVWFNQPYLADTFKEGTLVSLSGKISQDKRGLYLSNPSYEKISNNELRIANNDLKHTGRLVPIYPETEGITSKYLRFLIKPIIEALPDLPDPLPADIRERYHFTDYISALKAIHFPAKLEDAEPARKRFAFEELLLLQLRTLQDRAAMQSLSAPQIHFEKELIADFVKHLPFTLTDDQRRSAFEILQDIDRPHPMNRLLNGDVGSGKTVVALIAAYQAVHAGYQAVFMAPTEILAKQHYATITALISNFELLISKQIPSSKPQVPRVGLLTGSEARQWPSDENGPDVSVGVPTASVGKEKISKKLLTEKIARGQIDIIIGTHAVVQKNVVFTRLSLVIIDEQHRFGVAQRKALQRGHTQTPVAQNDADFLYEDITYKIRGAIFTVKKALGLGHKELVYHNALISEFNKLGLRFESEKAIDVYYDGKKVGSYQPDFIVEDKIIIELKTLPFKAWKGQEQTWKYLRATQYKLAMLVNFSTSTVQIERIIFDTARRVSASPREVSEKSASIPHLLSMTATPIPRTLALTIYGDLDVSLLKEKPKGRQEIITKVVSSEKRPEAYVFIEKQIQEGRQVFVICPRIDVASSQQPEAESKKPEQKKPSQAKLMWADVKAVTEEFEKLSKTIFPHRRVAMLHGKLPAKEKEQIMLDFKEKKYDILVSTSVIEVGVDIPNATIMMIESAERFGLAPLHQFRGRVGRGAHQSYCFLFTTDGGATRRLKAMEATNDGFKLAEMDLKIRGPGEFTGTQQSGIPDLAMASLSDIDLIKQAREEAKLLLAQDPSLAKHPLLAAQLAQLQRVVHFE